MRERSLHLEESGNATPCLLRSRSVGPANGIPITALRSHDSHRVRQITGHPERVDDERPEQCRRGAACFVQLPPTLSSDRGLDSASGYRVRKIDRTPNASSRWGETATRRRRASVMGARRDSRWGWILKRLVVRCSIVTGSRRHPHAVDRLRSCPRRVLPFGWEQTPPMGETFDNKGPGVAGTWMEGKQNEVRGVDESPIYLAYRKGGCEALWGRHMEGKE
ncbi:hypothetical protein DFH06DRAFT_1475814 [Mycena polygramma]|nr:hypothetical protein DFH06DRAFT_1475814 [Mycena polygramma]